MDFYKSKSVLGGAAILGGAILLLGYSLFTLNSYDSQNKPISQENPPATEFNEESPKQRNFSLSLSLKKNPSQDFRGDSTASHGPSFPKKKPSSPRKNLSSNKASSNFSQKPYPSLASQFLSKPSQRDEIWWKISQSSKIVLSYPERESLKTFVFQEANRNAWGMAMKILAKEGSPESLAFLKQLVEDEKDSDRLRYAILALQFSKDEEVLEVFQRRVEASKDI
ncbi:MAG: HEAT repeat domain-containing protein, partial [Planctomycetota bacterium]